MSQIYPFVSHRGFSVTQNIGAPESTAVTVSGVSSRWMQGAGKDQKAQDVVNANQLTSLSAMIAYISAQSGRSEFRIERSLADQFHIPNAKCLPADQFDRAIRYLVETLSA